MHWKRDLEVLTPLFNRGAYQDTPELRVPSIRGLVRWWFRTLGGTPDEEKEAFGGMKKFGRRLADEVMASRLVFRVSQVRAQRASPNPLTLPHKQGGQASPQAAFAPGATFALEVFTRFGDLSPELERKVENALEVWLLLGAFGLRANRAGGNVWPANGAIPASPSALRARLTELGCRWPIMLAGLDVSSTLEQLRAAATDTVDGMPHVFGQVRGGRIASKVKFKIVRLEGHLRLLILAPEQRVLDEARRALQGHRSKPETWQPV
jgi:CRISPR/Cas system CMR-associated protein Cmr1 (group 7 of RAMP superfamily)